MTREWHNIITYRLSGKALANDFGVGPNHEVLNGVLV
jgi:hypothetical protein